MEPHGPDLSFKYPQFSAILVVHKNEVFTKVGSQTAIGKVYQLTQFETQKVDKKLLLKSTEKKWEIW